MVDNIYVFETLRATGTTVVFDDGTGNDWVFLDGFYPAVSGHSGPSSTLSLSDPVFGIVAHVTVWDSASAFYAITFTGGIENIRGSAGTDFIDGNGGANILMGDATDVAGGFDWNRGFGGDDTLLGVGGGDLLWGGTGDDLMFGDNDPFAQDQGNFAAGDDTLLGDEGNDRLSGGFGNNTLNGGADLDVADYSGFFDDFGTVTHAIHGNLETGIVTVRQVDLFDGTVSTVATDLLLSIETLVGTVGNDVLVGQSTFAAGGWFFDQLFAGAGNDTVTGGAYVDAIYGGDGNDDLRDGGNFSGSGGGVDALAGGAGNDLYYVTTFGAAVTEFAGAGTDTVIAGYNYSLTGNVENLTMAAGVGTALFGNGNDLGNLVNGNGFANGLWGFDGNDTIWGRAGADTLIGGLGQDRLFGGSEADVLSGGASNDRLSGGTGLDRMTGGGGADLFLFASAAEAGAGMQRDVIVDFTPGIDRIDLSKIMAGQSFIGGALFSRVVGEVRYDPVKGVLAGDLDGDRAADYQIVLGGAPLLLGSDLIL